MIRKYKNTPILTGCLAAAGCIADSLNTVDDGPILTGAGKLDMFDFDCEGRHGREVSGDTFVVSLINLSAVH